MFPGLQIEGWVYLSWAVMLLVIPADWMFSALLAALVHELAHLTMLCFLGIRVSHIHIRLGGAQIHAGPMDDWQELLCALAGPAGSFAMVIVSRWLPQMAICAVVQGCYNLLPIYPFDGGRALRCCLRILRPKH